MTVLDLDTLTELRLILEEDIHLIAAQFAQQLNEQIILLTDHYRSGDLEQLKRTAHLIKGSAANLGASGLAEVAAVLEQAAKNADHPQITDSLTQVPEIAALTLTALQEQGIDLTLPE